MAWTESQIIQMIGQQVLSDQNLSVGLKDDCARIQNFESTPAGSALLISTDSLAEDIHFRRAQIDPCDLGWKSLSTSLSDLASKGARPAGFLLNWCLPPDLPLTWLQDFLQGLNMCAVQFQCPLIGGNTSASAGPIFISVTVLGWAQSPPYRTLGKPGDILAVTGSLGSSALGLSIQEGEWADFSLPLQLKTSVLFRHHHPQARIQEGQWLSQQGVSAMMDLSDGIFRDVVKLAEASDLTFEVNSQQIPNASELQFLVDHNLMTLADAKAFAIFGGEDFELLCAVPEASFARIQREFVKTFDTPFTRIGQLQQKVSMGPSPGVWLQLPKASTRFATLRFAHFSES